MRIKPLPMREYPEEMRAAMSALRSPDSQRDSSPTKERPTPTNLLGVMAHHPTLAQAYFTFNGHLLHSTTLSARQREILIMRVATVRRCESEWVQHLFIAREVGLSNDEISRIAYGPDAPFWHELDSVMLRSVDELLLDGEISEPTWSALSQSMSAQQLLDLIFTVGGYDTLAKVFDSLQLEIEEDTVELMTRDA